MNKTVNEKYNVSGMSCAACVSHVEKAVKDVEGVKEVNVNLLTNSMTVTYEEPASPSSITESVKKAGYEASLLKDSPSKDTEVEDDKFADKTTPRLLRRLLFSLILLIPLFYIGMGYMLDWPLGSFGENPFYVGLTEMLLSLAIMLINHQFFVSGFKSAIHRSPNMDTLVMLGAGIAWIYSVAILFLMGKDAINMDMDALMRDSMNLSFETSGMVPALITIGKTLESYSKGKTTNALKSLFDLAPKEAHLLLNDKEQTVLACELKQDDIFIVKPGESFPADGIVIKGESAVDESPLSGESLPVDKKTGDKVATATINQNGALVCKATHVGEETSLNQIIKMVEEASGTKTKISEIADKVAGIFVPVVLFFSLVTFLFWMIFGSDFVSGLENVTLLSYSLERAISILVISCPCALGLATPVAIMVGNGLGAKKGILFKNASALEKAGKIDFVVLDKTGTITEGKPKVTDILPSGGYNEEELLRIAYSIESSSSHPLAKAVVEKAKESNVKPFEVSTFENLVGHGVKVMIEKDEYLAGSQSFFKDKGFLTEKDESFALNFANAGKTPIFFAKNGSIIGIIAVADSIKNDSKRAIEQFKKLGITPIMVTGDNERTAKTIADKAGIEYVKAGTLPIEKQSFVKELKKYGKVAMIGDGINDAVALTEADVGIAIGAGSDIAIDSSEIVLMRSSLLDAMAAINIAKATYANIKENLFWAFFYNLVMIPIAAGAFGAFGLAKLKPWMGAAAMSLSSFSVVMNALRLNLFNPYKERKSLKKAIELPSFLEAATIKKEKKTMEVEIKVEGMMCEHCVAHVKEALEKVPGVIKANVSLKEKTATVKTEECVLADTLLKAIESAGYTARLIK